MAPTSRNSVIVHTEDGDVELFEGEYEIVWEIDEEWAKAHNVAIAVLPGTKGNK